MRLKEIKPGMIIHCKNEEELNFLLREAERFGYVWYPDRKPTNRPADCGMTIHFYENDRKIIAWSDKTKGVIEFSDLIMPELTAEEVIKTLGEIKGTCAIGKMFCCDCPLHDGNNRIGLDLCDFENFVGNEEVVKEICAEWKAYHEKKSLEIETVDICRIIKVLQDKKRVVHEEVLTGEYGSTKEEEAQEILKQYIAEHEGNYIAVVEHVYRVKE